VRLPRFIFVSTWNESQVGLTEAPNGKSAGAQTAGVLCGFGKEPELKKMGADLILQDTTKLLDVLK
jgi:phosphoglycolate phosphatase-like HAD superfamily hydrolase